MTKDKYDYLAEEYPEEIKVYPREEFNNQLANFLRSRGLK